MRVLNGAEMCDYIDARTAALDRMARENPFASAAWVRLLVRFLAEEGWTFFACEAPNGDILLAYTEPERPRTLRSLTSYYASLYTPVSEHVLDSEDGMNAVVESLRFENRFAKIVLWPMTQQAVREFHAAFSRRAYFFARRFDCFGNWYLPCDGLSFDEYMSARPSRLQNTWKRKRKKFFGTATEGEIEFIFAPEDVDRGLDAYWTVYNRSWKGEEPYPEFINEWAKECARNGDLRMAVAWMDGVPIACQFWFTMNRRAYIFKLAYDEEYARMSAGTVLTAELIRHVLDEDEVVEIDYLTGDDEYKKTWMTHRRQRSGLFVCNIATFPGATRAIREAVGAIAKRWTALGRPGAVNDG